MLIYIVFEEAVYRHEILGVYDNLEEAKTVGREYISKQDHDGHHDVVIGELPLGKQVNDITILGYFRKKKSYSDEVNHPVKEHFND